MVTGPGDERRSAGRALITCIGALLYPLHGVHDGERRRVDSTVRIAAAAGHAPSDLDLSDLAH